MRILRSLLALSVILSAPAPGWAQSCPPNVDFEGANLSNWVFFTGVNNGGTNPGPFNPSVPLATRHTLTTGNATDYYGGFPVVSPGGGSYSLRLGNNEVGKEMDQARYVVSVPATTSNFSLIYRYAVVFEDPGHGQTDQPFFNVRVYNSVTNQPVNCNSHKYIAQSGLPGFQSSPINSSVYYRSWTTGSLNLSGQAGQTLIVEFTAADCSFGGHFGYGYVDMSCGLFAITNSNCSGAAITPLSAPLGFKAYTWYNSDYSVLVDTGRNISIPSPPTPTVYHVVLTPFPGYGCVDTLTTQVSNSILNVAAGADTMVCNSPGVQLQPVISGTAPPFTYSWTPSASLSCNGCLNPIASPAVQTDYILTVHDAAGCTRTDTMRVAGPVDVSLGSLSPGCSGSSASSATINVIGGTGPFSIAWGTSPPQTGVTATGLPPGSYPVTATDAYGCTDTLTVQVTEVPPATATATGHNVTCYGQSNGWASVTLSGATGTVNHKWSTLPVQTAATAVGLTAGTYTDTVTYGNGCRLTRTVVITQPPPFTIGTGLLIRPCAGLPGGKAFVAVTGGKAPHTYYWNSAPPQTGDTLFNVPGGVYTVTVRDSNNCLLTATVNVPAYPQVDVTASPDVVVCAGDSARLSAAGARDYLWSPSTGLSCTACAATWVKPAVALQYTVTGTDTNGCRDTAMVAVSILPDGPSSVGAGLAICPGESTQLNATGGETYQWSPAATLDDAGAATPTAKPAATTTYAVIVKKNDCFSDTLQQKVIVYPQPRVDAGPDVRAFSGTYHTLHTVSEGAATFGWSPAEGLDCATCPSPSLHLNNSENYVVTVTSSDGCISRDTVRVNVTCSGDAVFFANTFTPNGDGENDRFYPQCLSAVFVKHFMIYDRWGERVFAAHDIATNNPDLGWNGTLNNIPLKPDVYVYSAEFTCADGSPVIVKGDIGLIR